MSAYKKSFGCVTMRITVMENGRRVDKMTVTDTKALKQLIKKYSMK